MEIKTAEEAIYTIPEIAKLLGVHRDTVQFWIEQGQLGHVKIGYRTIRVLQSDVDKFIEDRHTKGNYVKRGKGS